MKKKHDVGWPCHICMYIQQPGSPIQNKLCQLWKCFILNHSRWCSHRFPLLFLPFEVCSQFPGAECVNDLKRRARRFIILLQRLSRGIYWKSSFLFCTCIWDVQIKRLQDHRQLGWSPESILPSIQGGESKSWKVSMKKRGKKKHGHEPPPPPSPAPKADLWLFFPYFPIFFHFFPYLLLILSDLNGHSCRPQIFQWYQHMT